MDFIASAAAPAVAKKPDSNRFQALTVADLITNATHTQKHLDWRRSRRVVSKMFFVVFVIWQVRRICKISGPQALCSFWTEFAALTKYIAAPSASDSSSKSPKSGSGGIGALDQIKTGGKGRIIEAVGSG